jgi:hypothetical protein
MVKSFIVLLKVAHNLAWKFALVVKGQAADPEKLLDSYSEERIPIIRKTVDLTSNLVKAMQRAGSWYSSFFVYFLASAIGYKSIQRIILPNLFQVDSFMTKAYRSLICVYKQRPMESCLLTSVSWLNLE